jgi:hypothetical protein
MSGASFSVGRVKRRVTRQSRFTITAGCAAPHLPYKRQFPATAGVSSCYSVAGDGGFSPRITAAASSTARMILS